MRQLTAIGAAGAHPQSLAVSAGASAVPAPAHVDLAALLARLQPAAGACRAATQPLRAPNACVGLTTHALRACVLAGAGASAAPAPRRRAAGEGFLQDYKGSGPAVEMVKAIWDEPAGDGSGVRNSTTCPEAWQFLKVHPRSESDDHMLRDPLTAPAGMRWGRSRCERHPGQHPAAACGVRREGRKHADEREEGNAGFYPEDRADVRILSPAAQQ